MNRVVIMALAALVLATPAGAGEAQALAVGRTMDVALTENPSTGYAWTLDQSASAGLGRIVRVTKAAYTPGAAMPGAPGVRHWTITALKPGEATVVLNYRRPWENAAPAQTRRIELMVGR